MRLFFIKSLFLLFGFASNAIAVQFDVVGFVAGGMDAIDKQASQISHPKDVDFFKRRCLAYAASIGALGIVQTLCEQHTINPNKSYIMSSVGDTHGSTQHSIFKNAFCVAQENGHTNVEEYLVSRKAYSHSYPVETVQSIKTNC